MTSNLKWINLQAASIRIRAISITSSRILFNNWWTNASSSRSNVKSTNSPGSISTSSSNCCWTLFKAMKCRNVLSPLLLWSKTLETQAFRNSLLCNSTMSQSKDSTCFRKIQMYKEWNKRPSNQQDRWRGEVDFGSWWISFRSKQAFRNAASISDSESR